MARIRGYIASSLDGFIAAPGDDLAWLFAYEDAELGEHHHARFLERIRTVVMGRSTYAFLAAQPGPWPYRQQRSIVVTSSPLVPPTPGVEVRGEVDALVAELRRLDDGDVWMLGGGELQMAFIERDALDEVEIFVFPEILGGGTPLFPPHGVRRSPGLVSAKALDRGCVRLHYTFSGT